MDDILERLDRQRRLARYMTIIGACLLLIGVLLWSIAHAQTAAPFTVSWQLPTQAMDNQPLAGASALTSVRVFVSPTSILDSVDLLNPTSGKLAPTATSYLFTPPNTSTLLWFIRVGVCNASETGAMQCSLSDEITKKTAAIPVAKPAKATAVKTT